MPPRVIVYDCEIENCIPQKNAPRDPALTYCMGWRDFTGMGLSVMTAYDTATARYRVFMLDNLHEFADLVVRADFVCGFNNGGFDDLLMQAIGVDINPAKSVDLLSAVWQAAGLGPRFGGAHYQGYGLDALYAANLDGPGKTSSGEEAPGRWQRGLRGNVTDYCLNDTIMTVELVRLALEQGVLVNPRADHPLQMLDLRSWRLYQAWHKDSTP